jgi:hypothetical protein
MIPAARHHRLSQRRLQCQILHALLKRRDEQDYTFGGPTHDDTHRPPDWLALARTYTAKADSCQDEAVTFIDTMLDVAALAVAAIERSQRTQTSHSAFRHHLPHSKESL